MTKLQKFHFTVLTAKCMGRNQGTTRPPRDIRTLFTLCLYCNVERRESQRKALVPQISSHCVLGLYCNHGEATSDGEARRCCTDTTWAPALAPPNTALNPQQRQSDIMWLPLPNGSNWTQIVDQLPRNSVLSKAKAVFFCIITTS